MSGTWVGAITPVRKPENEALAALDAMSWRRLQEIYVDLHAFDGDEPEASDEEAIRAESRQAISDVYAALNGERDDGGYVVIDGVDWVMSGVTMLGNQWTPTDLIESIWLVEELGVAK